MSSTPTVTACKLPTKCCNFVGNRNCQSHSLQSIHDSIGPFMVTIVIIFVISSISSWLLRKKDAQHSRNHRRHELRTEQVIPRTNLPEFCSATTFTILNFTWLRPWHLSTNSPVDLTSCSSLHLDLDTCSLAWREFLLAMNPLMSALRSFFRLHRRRLLQGKCLIYLLLGTIMIHEFFHDDGLYHTLSLAFPSTVTIALTYISYTLLNLHVTLMCDIPEGRKMIYLFLLIIYLVYKMLMSLYTTHTPESLLYDTGQPVSLWMVAINCAISFMMKFLPLYGWFSLGLWTAVTAVQFHRSVLQTSSRADPSLHPTIVPTCVDITTAIHSTLQYTYINLSATSKVIRRRNRCRPMISKKRRKWKARVQIAVNRACRSDLLNEIRIRRYIDLFPKLRIKGRILGGAPTSTSNSITTLNRARTITTQMRTSEPYEPLSDDEDWWPLYILMANRCKDPSDSRPFTRYLLNPESFQDLPASEWKKEMSCMGIDFTSKTSPICQILPPPKSLSNYDGVFDPPELDIPHLSLEEALCHLRLVYRRVHRLKCKKKKIIKKFAELNRKKCPLDKHEIDQRRLKLWEDLSTSRRLIRQHEEILKKLQVKTKTRVKETYKALPRSVFVPYDCPPIHVYNRFAILDESTTSQLTKGWNDFIRLPAPPNQFSPPQRQTYGLLDKLPIMDPAEAMLQLRHDLTCTYATQTGHVEGTMYDVIGDTFVNSADRTRIGCFKTIDAETVRTMMVTTLNVNGLNGMKARTLAHLMKQDNGDVLVCVDTRHTDLTIKSYRKIFKDILGAGSQIYFSKDPNRRYAEYGGIIIVIGVTWGPSYLPGNSRTDDTGQGILARVHLRTTTGFLSIMGTYWPFVPPKDLQSKSAELSHKLWHRVKTFCKSRHAHKSDPIEYIQHLMVQWMNQDTAEGCEGHISCGDYNSKWSSSDIGGQRTLLQWASNNYLINGPRLIAERGNLTFITYGRAHRAGGTWIDHILHVGNPDIIDILGAFNDQGLFYDDISDHKPLIAIFRTSSPRGAKLTPVPKAAKRPELPRSDKRQIALFKFRLNEVLQQIPYTTSSTTDAEIALDFASRYMVQLTREISDSFHKSSNTCKNGFSPEYVLRKFHLCAVINIKRHIFRLHGASPWVGLYNIRQGIFYTYESLWQRARGLGITDSSIERILNVSNATSEFWLSLKSGPSEGQLDSAIGRLRKALHGRNRIDMRLAHKGAMAFIEMMRERGKLKYVIKHMLGIHAGRKHQDGLVLESVTLPTGEIIGEPSLLHQKRTDFYTDYYKIPEEHDNEFHRADNWNPYIQDKAMFLKIFENSNIPTKLLDIIHQALQEKDRAQDVRDNLTEALRNPPSLEDFKKGIRYAKTNSAPGPSGLSYNMLKSAPAAMIEYIYNNMCFFWNSTATPEAFKWRFLHTLPKTLSENMGFADYRPLMLCETLRKLWTTHIVDKILDVLRHHDVLEPVHHAFLPGRGTDTAALLYINHIEDVEEKLKVSHQTSFDLKKAFDTPSKPLMNWSWRRVGVPDLPAEHLVNLDIDGTTIVRTPYAEHMWEHLPYACVQTTGKYPPATPAATPDSALVQSFSPERGIGQGAPESPPNWIAIMDIPATALRILDSQLNTPTYVSGEDNDVYEHPGLVYADDQINASHFQHIIQQKAELLSACCIVLGLQLSDSKIRRLLQNFLPDKQKHVTESMTVYTVGWIPHTVKIQTSGHMDFVGGRFDTDNSSQAALEWVKEKAQLSTHCLMSRTGSDAAKMEVMLKSTLKSMEYKASLSFISHEQLREVDSIIDKMMVRTTKNMFSYPRKLIHINRCHGGLGIPSFSQSVDTLKLQKLWGCMRSQQLHHFAAKGLLSRLARKHGYHATSGQQLLIWPKQINRKDQKLFCDGPLEMLHEYNLYICRRGIQDDIKQATCLLPNIIPRDNTDLRNFCHDNGFFNISDLTEVNKDGDTRWISHPMTQIITACAPDIPSGNPPLLVGQYWKTTTSGTLFRRGDIIRIDGKVGKDILFSKFTHIGLGNNYTITLTQHITTIEELFPGNLAIRCHLQQVNSDRYKLLYPRAQLSPKWTNMPLVETPKWIQWITHKLHEQTEYIARPYTDGAYTCHANILGYFRKSEHYVDATAAIIIKDDTTEWKSKPVFAIYIANGRSLQPDSAYTMEYVALAGALQLTAHNLDKIHATGSDALSILESLPGRRQRLQHILHDHHYLLQCIDNSLYQGAPMPYHVTSHPENRKKEKDKHGCYGEKWTKDDWGNWIADRIAAQDHNILRKHGINIHEYTIEARDIYDALAYSGQWYIGDCHGRPILPKGASAIMQEGLLHTYLVERDEYRAQRKAPPVWENDNSMTHAADVYALKSSSPKVASTKTRIIFDKGYHGGNRAKDDSLTDEERLITETCILCGKPDSQDHWLHQCSYPPCIKIRDATFTELNKKLTEYRSKSTLHRHLGTAFKNILMTTDAPARIWTANWGTKQIQDLENQVNLTLLERLHYKDVKGILLPLEKILADGAMNLWQCKTVSERQLQSKSASTNQSQKDKDPSDTHRKPRQNLQNVKHKGGHNMTKEMRRRTTVPIHVNNATTMITDIVFPSPTNIQIKKLASATCTLNTSKTITKIDNFPIIGGMLQRLCGDEHGTYYEGGRLHSSLIRAFIRLLISSTSTSCILLDEDTTTHILTGNLSKISKYLEDVTRTRSASKPQWIMILFTDMKDCRETTWVLSSLNLTKRQIYHHFTELTDHNSRKLYEDSINMLLPILNLRYNDTTTWSKSTFHPAISNIDNGVWICMVAHLLLYNVGCEILTQPLLHDARQYIAICLLTKTIPDLHSMLISKAGRDHTEIIINNTLPECIMSPDTYYPRESELIGYFPSYNLLRNEYTFIPNYSKDSTYISHQTISIPSLTESDKTYLRDLCVEKEKRTCIHTGGSHTTWADTHFVSGADLVSLLQPQAILTDTVDTLLSNHFSADYSETIYISTTVTQLFCHYLACHNEEQLPFHDKAIQHQILSLLQQIETRPWIVFAFTDAEHFMGVTFHYNSTSKEGTWEYIDSLKWPHNKYIDTAQKLLKWAVDEGAISLDSSKWYVAPEHPMINMTTQCKYSYPGQDVSGEHHIECGIYLVCMAILHTAGYSLQLLSPEKVHAIRPYLAYHLANKMNHLPITDWIHTNYESTQPTIATTEQPEYDKYILALPTEPNNNMEVEEANKRDHHSNTYEYPAMEEMQSRRHFPRRAKKLYIPDSEIPLPPGREIVHIPITDDSQTHTYAAASTLSDPALGIDAGKGLFMRRLHGPDSPLDDGDIIGYYTGCKSMTVQEMTKYMYEENPDIKTGFMLIFEGKAVDGWNHASNQYTCMTALLNDPCDQNLYNCECSTGKRKNSAGKYIGPDLIVIKAFKNIEAHQEGFFEYGESSFCTVNLGLHVMFKAVNHYWSRIIKNPEAMERWSRLPQARYLFNTPYHTCTPIFKSKYEAEIIRHFDRCTERTCHCDIQTYIDNMTLSNIAEKPKKQRKLPSGMADMIRINSTSLQLALKRRNTDESNIIQGSNSTHKTNQDVLLFPQATGDTHRIDSLCTLQDNELIRNVDQAKDPGGIWSIKAHELRRLRAGELTGSLMTEFLSLLCLHHHSLKCKNIDVEIMRNVLQLDHNLSNLHTRIHEDIFDCDYLFCPMSHNGHHSLITVDFTKDTILHEDPLNGYHHSHTTTYLLIVQNFLIDHWNHMNRLGNTPVRPLPSQWILEAVQSSKIPQQEDGISCGIYALTYAQLHAWKLPILSFNASLVPRMRAHIANSILLHQWLPLSLGVSNEEHEQSVNNTSTWYMTFKGKPVEISAKTTKSEIKPTSDNMISLLEDTIPSPQAKRTRGLISTNNSCTEIIDLSHDIVPDQTDPPESTLLLQFDTNTCQSGNNQRKKKRTSHALNINVTNSPDRTPPDDSNVCSRKRKNSQECQKKKKNKTTQDGDILPGVQDYLLAKDQILAQDDSCTPPKGRKRERKPTTTLSDRRQRTLDGYVVPDTRQHWDTNPQGPQSTPLDSPVCDDMPDVSMSCDVAKKPNIFECNEPSLSFKSKPRTRIGSRKPRARKGLGRDKGKPASVSTTEDNQNPTRESGLRSLTQIINVEPANPHSVALSSSLEHDKGIVFI